MDIVFCERCGVSIPEHQVTGTRQATGGRDLCASCHGSSPASEGDLRLYFCENCRVSIPISDVITGTARAEGAGYACTVCAGAAQADRSLRRATVEREMGVRPAEGPVLYFCEACNASVAAAQVATGRALVRMGRIYCDRCRVRVEREGTAPRSGTGVVVLASALLAALAAAGGLLLWQRWTAPAEDPAVTALAARLPAMERAIRAVEEGLAARGTEGGKALDRLGAAQEGIQHDVASVRAGADAARQEAAQDRAAQRRSELALADRIGTLEGKLEGIARELREQVRDLSADLDARAAGASPAGGAPAPTDGGAQGPVPTPVPNPADAAPPPQILQHVDKLKDPDIGARFAAAVELGKMAEMPGMLEHLRRNAVPALVEAMKTDKDVLVRRACVRSLGQIKAYDAVPSLVEVMMDPEEYVAKVAAGVLRDMIGAEFDKFGWKQGQPRAERRRVVDRAKRWWEENHEKVINGQK